MSRRCLAFEKKTFISFDASRGGNCKFSCANYEVFVRFGASIKIMCAFSQLSCRRFSRNEIFENLFNILKSFPKIFCMEKFKSNSTEIKVN